MTLLRTAGHLRPLLTSLAPLHNFTIETQIQYFAPLSIDLHQSDDGAMIEEGDLRAFVNSADWNMGALVHAKLGKVIN